MRRSDPTKDPHRIHEATGSLTDRANTRAFRPSNRDEWVRWYAERDDARRALHCVIMQVCDVKPSYWTDPSFTPDRDTRRRMKRAECKLRYWCIHYGLDYTTEAFYEDWWCAPKDLRRHFVKPEPEPEPSKRPVSKARYRPRGAAPEDGVIDRVLVRKVIIGDASASRLNIDELQLAAYLMHGKNRTHSDIARRLKCNNTEVERLIADYDANPKFCKEKAA